MSHEQLLNEQVSVLRQDLQGVMLWRSARAGHWASSRHLKLSASYWLPYLMLPGTFSTLGSSYIVWMGWGGPSWPVRIFLWAILSSLPWRLLS